MHPPVDIDRLADLAKLSLSPEERERLTKDMAALIAFADRLSAVETDGDTLPVSAPRDIPALREDTPAPSLPREELLRAAKTREDGYITVPRVVKE